MFKSINQYIIENKISELFKDYNLEKFNESITISLPFVYHFFKKASDTHYIKRMLSENGTYNILIAGEIGYILKAIEKEITKEIHKKLLDNEKFRQTLNELQIFYFLLNAGGDPKFINRTHRNSPDITVSIPNLEEITIEIKTIGISKKNIYRSEVSNIITNCVIEFAYNKNLTNFHFESSIFLKQKLPIEMVKKILEKKEDYLKSLKLIINKKEISTKDGFIKIPFIGILHFHSNNEFSRGTQGSISGLQFDSTDDYKKILKNGIKKASLQLKGYPNPFCIIFTNSRNSIIYSKQYSKSLRDNFAGIIFIEGYFNTLPEIRAEFIAFKLTKETRFMRKFTANLSRQNNRILLHYD